MRPESLERIRNASVWIHLMWLFGLLSFTGCLRELPEEPPIQRTVDRGSQEPGGDGSRNYPPAAATPVEKAWYDIEFRFGDDSAWSCRLRAGQTIISLEQVMRQLEAHPRAPKIEITGSDTTAFLAAVDNLQTESGRGWTFKINGERGERGIGQTQINPGDRIVWEYGSW